MSAFAGISSRRHSFPPCPCLVSTVSVPVFVPTTERLALRSGIQTSPNDMHPHQSGFVSPTFANHHRDYWLTLLTSAHRGQDKILYCLKISSPTQLRLDAQCSLLQGMYLTRPIRCRSRTSFWSTGFGIPPSLFPAPTQDCKCII